MEEIMTIALDFACKGSVSVANVTQKTLANLILFVTWLVPLPPALARACGGGGDGALL
jgi:hypothetical protein